MERITEQQALEEFNIKPKYNTGIRIYDKVKDRHGILKSYDYVINPCSSKRELIVMVWYYMTTNDGTIMKDSYEWVREDSMLPVLEYYEERIKYHTDRIAYLQERAKYFKTLDN